MSNTEAEHTVGALRSALKIIQFLIANVDSSVKGWPKADLNELAARIEDERVPLAPVEREVALALKQYAEPIIYHPTVAPPTPTPSWLARVFGRSS